MTNDKVNRNTVVSSLLWKILESFGAHGVTFIVSIILARLLEPKHFGVLSLITVFISISSVIVQSGLNTALIQNKEVDETDFSSVFFVSIIIAIFIYILLYLLAPFIENYYNEDGLVKPFRALALILIPYSYNSIQVAKISREFEFKKLFISTLGASILSGTIGIIFAYLGFGIWALVTLEFLKSITSCIIMRFTVKWRIELKFSFSRVKELFSFGSKLMVASLINSIYNELRNLVIGKAFSTVDLAYYSRGQQFPKMIVQNIDSGIQSVMLPTYSRENSNLSRVKQILRLSIRTSSYIVFPLMAGLAAIAEPLVKILLTEKWYDAIPILKIMCIVYSFHPMQAANLQAISALGRSDLRLKLELIKKPLGICILFLSIPYGIHAIAWGSALAVLLSSIINVVPNKKLIKYSFVEMIEDIIIPLLLSVFMYVIVDMINMLLLSDYIKIIIQIVVGVISYLLVSFLTRNKTLLYIIDTLKNFINRKC